MAVPEAPASVRATTTKRTSSQPRVAIVHDWLYGGGAERVVMELHRMYPDAPIYTSYCNDEWRAKLDGKVVTGYLQRWPFDRLRKFIPFLRIQWFGSLDLSAYDVVISSSGNGEAKGVCAGSLYNESQIHICYCHSPVHFYWRHYDQYLRSPGFGAFDPLARLGLRLLVGPLRRWDLKASKHPDVYAANSNHIKSDIKKYYGKDSTTVFPPVDTDRFRLARDRKTPGDKPRHGFVTVGRQQPYKRTDLIIEACNRLQLPLTVLGGGPDHDKLKALAGPTVTIIPKAQASDQVVTDAMQHAEGFIFAAFEDFGITPIEAMAAGTPVIGYRAGGALDYIEPGVTGQFFDEQTVESLVAALGSFKPKDYDHAAIARHAERFSAQHFREHMSALVDQAIAKQRS